MLSKNIKVIATDLDGTLTDKYNNMPIELCLNIRELMNLGIKFILCTARNIRSTVDFLGKYFSNKEISRFGFVTSGGSDLYKTIFINNELQLKKIFSFHYDITVIKSNSVVDSFLNKHRDRIIIKDAAILVPFGSKSAARSNVIKVNKLIKYSKIKCYLYDNILVLSLKSINKSRGLKIYLDKSKITTSGVLRIADQGDKYESDYEFINCKNGFTVGSKEDGNKNKCNYVVDGRGKVIRSTKATNYLFSELVSILKQ